MDQVLNDGVRIMIRLLVSISFCLAIFGPFVSKLSAQDNSSVSSAQSKSDIVKSKMEAYQKKKEGLLEHMMERHKGFYQSYLGYFNAQKELRLKQENDLYIPFTDVHIPPGELFSEKLLVARHSRLCLGETTAKRVSFHACNVNTGGLLWTTKKVYFDNAENKITTKKNRIENHCALKLPGKECFYISSPVPNPEYTRLEHNGACLTTPFQLKDTSKKARAAHLKKLMKIAEQHPSDGNGYLTLKSCTMDGRGQLWKVNKETHDRDNNHGFSIQERESGFCLRPELVNTSVNSKTQDVHAVFYPCNGAAHQTFEMFPPNDTLPVWYDHNGVIKSDNDLCLDVPKNEALNNKGTEVFLEECTNDQTDRWDYSVEYNKTVKIFNDYTGYCLYPYHKNEGAISGVSQGQLVQRPCDARFGQGWKLRLIPKSRFFQLEALTKDANPSGLCMIPNKPNPENPLNAKVKIYVKKCSPSVRGRWTFGHWEGLYQWTLWDKQNSGDYSGSINDLSKIYWIDKESLKNRNANGVCRIIKGDHNNASEYKVIPGTWNGKNNSCKYVEGDKREEYRPNEETDLDVRIEILTGVDIGMPSSRGKWVNSSGGVPHDRAGEKHHPPRPAYSPFMAGGIPKTPAYFLCRQKSRNDKQWYYGYQSDGQTCVTLSKSNSETQILVFDNKKT